MGIKIYKPTSAGRRKSSVDDFADITKTTPEKSLTVALQKNSGRNNQGKITVRHRGGGERRRYRLVDFSRDRFDQTAKVLAIEYDPNRNARIALLQYQDGTKSYIIAPNQLPVGQTVVSSQKKVDITVGNRMPIGYVPPGMMVHAVELQPGKRAMVARSAGNGVMVMAAEGDFVQAKLPSGEIRMFHRSCLATVGQVSNPDFSKIRWGKAGRMRHRGFRPSVRGKAMNPVDHPHGGGEGNQPIGLKHPKTPQGKPALGVRTRKPTRSSNKFIIKRRNAK
ncbi:MAG: 50S ribosomal protein L2 [Candidatus Kerfeldbacteria bacterium]|nr:50S ribosomal protein L2 [Candidatus Kerfeldbacteria bacterium]